MGQLPWHALMDFKFDALETYMEDWKATNEKIKSTVDDVDGTVLPGLADAFGGLDGTEYSNGGEAARDEAKSMASELEDARTEGKAVKKILGDFVEELRPIVKSFKELVDEVNGTKGPLETDNNYEVDIGGFIHPPTTPDLEELDKVKDEVDPPEGGWDTSEGALSIWQAVVDGKIAKWEAELDQLAEDAWEVDDEHSKLLNGSSATATEGFNGDADKEVEQASKEEQEKDAEEVEDRLSDGEVTEEDIEFANDKMKEHAGEEHFAVSLMGELGPEGLAEVYGQAAMESPASDKEMEDFQKYLGTTLATATDPDEDKPYLGQDYLDKFKKAGSEDVTFTVDGEETSVNGYLVLAPLLENGNFDNEFLVPVGEHIVQVNQFTNTADDWSTFGIDNEGKSPFNIRNPSHDHPVDAVMAGLGNSPEASVEFFTKDPENQFPDGYGPAHEIELPKSYMDYFAPKSGGLPIGGLDQDCIGAAFESAATGMDSDNPTNPPAKHDKYNAEFTRDLMTRVGKNPSLYGDGGELHGAMNNLADIAVSYIADIYQSETGGSDPASHEWMPKSWAEDGGELDMFSTSEKTNMDNFLNVLGKDPEAGAMVAVAGEQAATYAIENMSQSVSTPDDTMKALEGYIGTVQGLHEGDVDEMIEAYAKDDKDHNKMVDRIAGTITTVASAGITVQNPLAGGLLNQFVGDGIKEVAEQFKQDSGQEAEYDKDKATISNVDAMDDWASKVYYDQWLQYGQQHPDEVNGDLEVWAKSMAADTASEVVTKLEAKMGLSQ